jgi:hypothetical protein
MYSTSKFDCSFLLAIDRIAGLSPFNLRRCKQGVGSFLNSRTLDSSPSLYISWGNG